MLTRGLGSTLFSLQRSALTHGEHSKGKRTGAARVAGDQEDKASPAPGHAPGGVALRHMLLNCFGSVLQKSSEVGSGEPGAALLEVGEAAWL